MQLRSLTAGLFVLALHAPALAQTASHEFAPGKHGYGGDTSRPAPLPAKPTRTVASAENAPRTLEIKFAHGSDTRLVDGWFVGSDAGLGAINSRLAEWGATPRAMFVQTPEFLETWRRAGETRSGIALHDLNLFYFVDLPADGIVAELCDALNQFEHVQLAWPAVTGGDPVAPSCPAPAAALGGTPNFEGQQIYKTGAPNGVDAVYANTFSGGRGIGTTIIDCETGWTDNHEDLAGKADNQFVLWTPANYPWDHGTAVLGEMVGEHNAKGVRGIAYEAGVLLSTHTPVGLPQNIPASVANGAAAASPGDALVIEIQCFGAAPAPFPCEFDPAIFATVQTATANGVHVFAAAGNGGQNLDQAAYGGAFDLNVKDSGAVMVGASDGVSLVKAGFSNYGARTTSSGWGQNVVSTGYGDLQGGPAVQTYTSTFSGTSSATPIVAGSGVVLNAIHREAYGADMDPIALRTVLQDTGTTTPLPFYGTRPNLRAAIRELAIPELEVSGPVPPGGFFTATHRGDPGDLFELLWSPNLLDTPIQVAPLGYLFLDPTILILFPSSPSIGAGGETVDVYQVPPDSALIGSRTFLQSFQVFLTKPGVGSFSNWQALRVN